MAYNNVLSIAIPFYYANVSETLERRKANKIKKKGGNKTEDKLFYGAQKRIADLLKAEQGRLGLTNFQMCQRLDMPSRTYDSLISGKGWREQGCSLNILCNIFANTNINPCEVFKGEEN